jgi:hypothetical protein
MLLAMNLPLKKMETRKIAQAVDRSTARDDER